MLKIGLTGGIGSGKTMVANIFRVLGIPVFDADLEAKKLMSQNVELKNLLIKEFGTETYINGELNRPFLSAQVFTNASKLERLNAIIHPITIDCANRWMQQQTSPYVIKEAALLFEAGSAGHLDYVIGVSAPVPLRLERAMSRDNVSAGEIKKRMDRQISDTIKMKLCDFVLINDEQQLLIPQVLALHEQLMKIVVEKIA